MQTRQSSGSVGNGEGKDEGDCSPRAPSPTSMTSTASPTQNVPTGLTDLQHRRRRQQQQQLSLMQTTDLTVASSSSTCDETSRLSANVLFSLPTSPKRSSPSHLSSSKTAISKSQMKGESRLKMFHLLITRCKLRSRARAIQPHPRIARDRDILLYDVLVLKEIISLSVRKERFLWI